MRNHWRLAVAATIAASALALSVPHRAKGSSDSNYTQQAWEVLQSGVNSKTVPHRVAALRALGSLKDDPRARDFAEKALVDDKEEVRAAAATSLGNMGANESIPKLQQALDDKQPVVFLAAAQSLIKLGDSSGYDVYYEVLTGERKTKKGMIAKETKQLRDPKMVTEMSIGEVAGINPFTSLGWDVVKFAILDQKKDPSPAKAAAAKMLADDPDPSSSRALLNAAVGKDWIVQTAALDAIARRGDTSLIAPIVPLMTDDHDTVCFAAAAAVIRLSSGAK